MGDGTNPDDHSLAVAFLAGDEVAFRTLFRRHSPALHACTLRFLGRSANQAEDVVQETWLRAARALPRFEWRSSLRTWLIGIAVRCAQEARRREPPLAVEISEEHALTRQSPSDPDLERALRDLADGYREVLLLHDLLGFTHEEIAGQLGIEIGTSKSQLSRARQALRSYWLTGRRVGVHP
jgi:RNA polymerase sigma factor (sigma-70 family)